MKEEKLITHTGTIRKKKDIEVNEDMKRDKLTTTGGVER